MKVLLESLQTNCDHDFVEYFHKSPVIETLYTFRVVKPAPTFSISIILRAVASHRIMYRLKNLDGCQFISNPIMNKVFAQVFNAIIVNNTINGCPILPKVYFLKNMADPKVIPTFHPIGRYQTNVRIHMSQSPGPYVMEVIWRYNVVNVK